MPSTEEDFSFREVKVEDVPKDGPIDEKVNYVG